MTTPDLLKELEALVLLDARATPGQVELHTSCSWRRIIAERNRAFLVPTIDPDRHQNMDSAENAQFVVALVNWYRTHHAEIAEAVKKRDALIELLAQAQDELVCSHRSMTHETSFDEIQSKRVVRVINRIEPILKTQHNSAREGL
ncbi:MAG TPA: hypothetical protein VGU03_11125 [Frateuria sp.]|uniref:hypothetical protein n=1 Tax=Frateuria sp. TaxID=2211372 RepID=UPI002DF11B39|nr:hypothetical protein [Frateuria sp.]